VAKELQDELPDMRAKITSYHAGLDASVRAARQTNWTKGTVKIIVATIAFGYVINL